MSDIGIFTRKRIILPADPFIAAPVAAIIPPSGATWNSLDRASNITLSGGDLTAAGTTGSIGLVRSTSTPKSSGKYFMKLTVNHFGGIQLGITNATTVTTQQPGNDNAPGGGFGYAEDGHITGTNGTFGGFDLLNTGVTYTTGDVISMAVDLDNNKIWFRVGSGNWNGSGTDAPDTNTGGQSTSAGNALKPFTAAVSMNPALDAAVSVTADFSGTGAPTGFIAW